MMMKNKRDCCSLEQKLDDLAQRLSLVENAMKEIRESIGNCRDVENTRNDFAFHSPDEVNDIPLKTIHQRTTDYQRPQNIDKIEQTIRKERQSYAEGLTIHGASRIATGHPLNRIIWSVLVVASFTIAVLISKDHIDAFLSRRTTIQTSFVPQETMSYPAITVCDWQGLNRERRHLSIGPPISPRPILMKENVQKCSFNLSNCQYNNSALVSVDMVNYLHSEFTSLNHLAKIDNTTNCFTVDKIKSGDPKIVLDIAVVVNRSVTNFWSIFQVNPSSETFSEATVFMYPAGEGHYDVQFKRKITKLLGKPYTNCVQGRGTYSQNIFTGNYTIDKCKKGCVLENVFTKCGAIPKMYTRSACIKHTVGNRLL